MWGLGNIQYFPDEPHLDFSMWFDDEDGYPVEQWKKIEADYIKRKKAEDSNFVYKRPNNCTHEKGHRFIDYADRPNRYMYWYLETKHIPPSKRKK